MHQQLKWTPRLTQKDYNKMITMFHTTSISIKNETPISTGKRNNSSCNLKTCVPEKSF